MTPTADRFDNRLLDSMRDIGDPPADAVVASLFAAGEVDAVNALMRSLVRDDDLVPANLPAVVRDYLVDTEPRLELDPVKLARGQNLFALNGPEMLVALGFYSLPASYAARKGVQVIYRTAYLQNRPVTRVFETTQMVIDVLSPGGLGPTGRGVVTAQKVRLMHAAVRHLITHDAKLPWDLAELGVPLNQEDLAGTLMTFTYLVLDGLARLGIVVPGDDQEGYLHAWVAVGRILGVREELLPANVAEARVLTETIYTRQIAASPEGAALTAALLEAMQGLIPIPNWAGIPAGLVHFFLGKDAISGQDVASLLGVPSQSWPQAAARIIGEIGEISERFGHDAIGAVIRFFSRHLVQGLLNVSRGGTRAPFAIPDSLREHWGMSPPTDRAA